MRKDVLRDVQRTDDQQRSLQEREREWKEVGVGKVGLNCKHPDRPQILDHEDAEGDPSRQRVQLELVVEELDHDKGARQAHARGEVKERIVAGRVAHADQVEEAPPECDAYRHLQSAGEENGRACRRQLLEVDLEPDDEEQENEPDLGDSLDAGLVLDEVEHVGTDDHPGHQVGEDQRLSKAPADER